MPESFWKSATTLSMKRERFRMNVRFSSVGALQYPSTEVLLCSSVFLSLPRYICFNFEFGFAISCARYRRRNPRPIFWNSEKLCPFLPVVSSFFALLQVIACIITPRVSSRSFLADSVTLQKSVISDREGFDCSGSFLRQWVFFLRFRQACSRTSRVSTDHFLSSPSEGYLFI